MPILYDKNGKAFDVPDNQVVEALKSGQFGIKTRKGRFNVANSEGKAGSIDGDPAELIQAYHDGFHLETPEEETKRVKEENLGGAGGQILSGVTGAGRGLTFGLSDVAMAAGEKLGLNDIDWPVVGSINQAVKTIDPTSSNAPELLSSLKEVNPTTSTGSEIAGAILPLLLSGGASAPVSAANEIKAAATGVKGVAQATLPSLLSKGSTLLGQKLATKLGVEKISSSLLQGLAKVGTKSLVAGGEGAIYGVGQTASELALDPELAAENWLGNIGMGAAFGMGSSLAFEGLLPAIGKGTIKGAKWGANKILGQDTSALEADFAAYKAKRIAETSPDVGLPKVKAPTDEELFREYLKTFDVEIPKATPKEGKPFADEFDDTVIKQQPKVNGVKIKGDEFDSTYVGKGPKPEADVSYIGEFDNAPKVKSSEEIFGEGLANGEVDPALLSKETKARYYFGQLYKKGLIKPGFVQRQLAKGTGIAEEEIGAHLSGKIHGVDFGKEIREIAQKADDSFKGYVDNIVKLEDEITDSADAVFAESREFKLNNIEQIIKKGNEKNVVSDAFQILDDMDSELGSMRTIGAGEFGQAPVKRLQERIKAVKTRITSSIKNQDTINSTVFNQLDNLKRDVGRFRERVAKGIPEISQSGQEALSTAWNTSGKLEDIYENIRQFLEKDNLFGKASVAQREINKAWTEYLDACQHEIKAKYYRRAGRKIVESLDGKKEIGWEHRYQADPKGIEQIITKGDIPEGKLDWQNFINKHEKLGNLLKAHQNNYVLEESLNESIDKSVGNLKSMKTNLENSFAESSILRESGKIKGAQMPSLLSGGNVSGMVGGALLGSAIGVPWWMGGIAAGGVVRLLQTLQSPKTLLSTRLFIDKWGGGIEKLISKLPQNMGKKIRTPAAITGIKLEEAFRGDSKSKKMYSKDPQAAFQMMQEHLVDKTKDPDIMKKKLGVIAQAQPEIADIMISKSQQAVDYLLAKAPKAKSTSIAQMVRMEPGKVSKEDINSWLKRVATVNNPMKMINIELESGILSKEVVETLKAVYPKLHGEVVKAVLAAMSKVEDLPYSTKLRISNLLGIPVDNTLKPNFIASLQSIHNQAVAEQQAAMKPNQIKNIPGSNQTNLEALQNRRQS